VLSKNYFYIFIFSNNFSKSCAPLESYSRSPSLASEKSGIEDVYIFRDLVKVTVGMYF